MRTPSVRDEPSTHPGIAPYLATYASQREALRGSAMGAPESRWLDELREAGLERFAAAGFPTPQDEDWRKTNVAPIVRTRFGQPQDGRTVGGVSPDALAQASIPPAGCVQVVCVNGTLRPDASSPARLPAGVVVCGLAEALERHRGLVEPYLARIAAIDDSTGAFTALNTAFLRDGLFVWIPEGADVQETIHLLFVETAGGQDAPFVVHPRALIVAGQDSRARLVESYVALSGGSAAYLTNAVTEIAIGPGAVLEHCRLQREGAGAYHVAATRARQGRGSRYASHSVSMGAALSRHDTGVVLAEEGSECVLNGLYLAWDTQHVDNHTTIDHATPNCISRELFKGVLDGRARGVFNGKIVVRPEARGTDSVQTNRNLLLSDDALVDTKPELQINNNDVKCRHAAAIGQLDEAAIFYLRSRGIGHEAARSLLVHAFVGDVLGRIPVAPLRDTLEGLLMVRLPGFQGVKEAAL